MLAEQGTDIGAADLDPLIAERDTKLDPRSRKLLDMWPKVRASYSGDEYVVKIRHKEIRTALTTTSLSGSTIPKRGPAAKYEDEGEILKWLLKENLPGSFPYTAGVFAFKRENEDPTRMFAGEGDAFRTNKRFKYLSKDNAAKRLSTAFDSVTLYGWDPDKRPDIYGKVGTSGVSIATLDDMKVLYGGFDLRSLDLGLDDHQRAGADHPRHVPQHGDRPATSKFEEENGRRRPTRRSERSANGCSRPSAARCRPTS